MKPPIEISEVSLAYRLARTQTGTLKEFLISLFRRQVGYQRLWALSEVSFEVNQGEVFGVIGPNGAGKSTLMKVIARVLPPTNGRVIVRGSVAPMIELGAGFNVDLTGRENIVMYGTLLGRSPAAMRKRVEPIGEWSGLTDFLDVPIRSYSSGMLARLGFAIATDSEPDILVVDEVLSVGDAAFQQKSMARMRQLISLGTAVVFVSHDLPAVRQLANRVMWLDRGHIRTIGEPEEVVEGYRLAVEAAPDSATPDQAPISPEPGK